VRLRGEQTLLKSLWAESAQHIARHVPDTYTRELSGVGHFAPVLAPELLSEELTSFIERENPSTHIDAISAFARVT
jgi:hypothetical protein